jgi:hypothetical protein
VALTIGGGEAAGVGFVVEFRLIVFVRHHLPFLLF